MKKILMLLIISASILSCKAQIKQEGNSLKFDFGTYQVNDSVSGFWQIPYENEQGQIDTIFGYSKEIRDVLMPDYWNGFNHTYPNGIMVAYSLIDSVLYFKVSVTERNQERIYGFLNPVITIPDSIYVVQDTSYVLIKNEY